ncbi:aminotransferase class III-fold pyridoxal phosphate-dependent enzyme [Patescibacteria group bacterium]|nr:aminotransferase class III-fold pyridoxal phosphate-dependent enzyme [Patescibacteria group bacterium]
MNIQAIENQHLIPVYAKRDIALVKGRGVFLFDEHNKKYLDLTSNYGVNVLGYSNKNYQRALKKQLSRLSSVHSSFYNDTRAKFLAKLHSLIPLTHSFISNTGSESIEVAIKFARLVTKKKQIISAQGGYHGRTIGALSATFIPKYQRLFTPLAPGFKRVVFNDIDELKQVINGDTAAVLLEPIQGEAGVIIPTIGYLRKVKKLCQNNNILLILDEIQTGLRTGHWLASEYFKVKPDILCLSKGLGNGFPIAVTAVSKKIAQQISRGSHGTTFGGSPLACAAGLATLEEIDNNKLLENSKQVGKYFLNNLKQIKSPLIREVRGLGLMIAIELKRKAGPYVKKLQADGILVMLHQNLIRVLPPLIISRSEVDQSIKKFKKILC